MSEPMFVAIEGDIWVNARDIESISPTTIMRDADTAIIGTQVQMRSGRIFRAPTPARDFINRMTGLVWK